MTLKEELLQELQLRPGIFLRELAWQLHIAARTYYLAADDSLGSRQRLEGMNELGVLVPEELRSQGRNSLAYPYDVFLEVLDERAVPDYW